MNTEQIIKTEENNIERLLTSVIEEISLNYSPKNVITQISKLVENRKRYLGKVGEFYSILNFEGIEIVDRLDEKTLKTLNYVFEFTQKTKGTLSEEHINCLKEKLLKGMPRLPEHPVGYMVLFVLANLLDVFLDESGFVEEKDVAEYTTLVHHLVSNYVKIRETPLIRHFSDVAREYSVVARLVCVCKKAAYVVKQQNLRHNSSDSYFDLLEIICKNCGNTQTIEFPLLHFKDFSTIIEKDDE